MTKTLCEFVTKKPFLTSLIGEQFAPLFIALVRVTPPEISVRCLAEEAPKEANKRLKEEILKKTKKVENKC